MPKSKRTSSSSPAVDSGRKKKSDEKENTRENDLYTREDSVESSPLREETPVVPRLPKKRAADEEIDFTSEMQKTLECFGADITQTLLNKRKRLEQVTQSSLKSANKKVEDIWKMQQAERNKLHEEYHRQVHTVFQQWESDIEKTKEQEEKLVALFKQQQKLFQQARIVQSQRLRTIQQLHDQYVKGNEELGKTHTSQQSTVQSELKKEMALLQKRILMDCQQMEMANVRKSLQAVLF